MRSPMRLAAALAAIAFGGGGCGLFGERTDPLRWEDPAVSLATAGFPGVPCPPDAVVLNVRRDGSVWFGGMELREGALYRFLDRAADTMREEPPPLPESVSEVESESWDWENGRRLYHGRALAWVEEGLSERPVVIRADARASWEAVQRVLWHAQDEGIYQYFLSARRADSGGESLLPTMDSEMVIAVEGGRAELEHVRIRMLSRPDGRGIECKVNNHPVPFDPAGDPSAQGLEDHLRGLLRTTGNVPVILDAQFDVPAGFAILALDKVLSAGFEEACFSVPDFLRRAPLSPSGTPPPKPVKPAQKP